MKALYLSLALILLSYVYSGDCNREFYASEAKECHSSSFNTTKYYRCCFLNSKHKEKANEEEKENKLCLPLPKSDYDDIDAIIKKLKEPVEKEGGVFTKFSIDCSSNYIVISILSLILLLL